MDYLEVTREAMDAYERRTGFSGIGRILVQRGLAKIREREECLPEA